MILPVSFQGKRILVSGAARGLGKALVKALVANQGTVYAISRTPANLAQLKKEVPQVTTICTDLANWDDAREKVKALGHFDCLVNNAALNIPGTLMDVTPAQFDETFKTNVLSSLNLIQIVGRSMIDGQKGGSIVNVSSATAANIFPMQGLYGMSKTALGMLTRIMATELGPHNIRVNTVNPGIFPSDMSKKALENPNGRMIKGILDNTPLGRICTTEEVVNVIMFLLSDACPYVTGQSWYICGGNVMGKV